MKYYFTKLLIIDVDDNGNADLTQDYIYVPE